MSVLSDAPSNAHAAASDAPALRDSGAGHDLGRSVCDHCGLDVPPALVEPDAEQQFCCAGCRAVFGIINSHGLDRYYRLRRSLEREKARPPESSLDPSMFDDPAFEVRHTQPQPDGTRRAVLALEGIHCPACVWLIERLPRVQRGVLQASVSFGRGTVDVRWDPASCRFSDVARALRAMGYPAGPPRGGEADAERQADARRQLVRIGVAGALAGNVMLVSIALYAGVFEGIEARFVELFRWVSAGLGVLALAWPGRVFFKGALGAIRARSPHLDLPIALALLVGGVWGLANVARGTGEIYFDSLTALVFLLLVGRFVQSQQQRRAADAVDLLLTLTPGTVRTVADDGTTTTRPVEAVGPGDLAEVHAGETIPIDGVVDSGAGEIDRAILTGESAPVAVGPGDDVHAGSVNLSAPLRVRVSAAGEETRAARLMRLVADAAEKRSPVVRAADRVAGWFVIVVAALAAATAIGWSLSGVENAVERGIEHATALLIVSCPCALGLATPLVLSVTIGRLARAGVLVKGGEQLERLSRPGRVLLDKTGTLTTGSMRVREWTVDGPLAARVRALESRSTHPIARAIAASGTICPAPVHDCVQSPGLGIRGVVGDRDIAAGTAGWLAGVGIALPERLRAWADAAAENGMTPVLIAEDGVAAGGVALSDTLREDAHGLIDELRRTGWEVGLLSGDDERVVERVAGELGLPAGAAVGRASPEDKLAAVEHEVHSRRGGTPVVMVGDGVNDAAALAAADVGIAVQGGADTSLDAAPVSLQRGGLRSVAMLLSASSAAMRRIRLCMGVSIAYNASAAALAMAGMIHPLVAAVLMPMSSITVVSIAASRSGTRRGGADGSGGA